MRTQRTVKAMKALICFIALGVASQAIAGKTHYRWVDDRGHPVHSDRPPPKGIDYEVVSTGSGLKRVVTGDQGAVPAEIEPRVGNEFTQIDTNEASRSKKNPEMCERARTNLATLTSNVEVKIRDDQGEERFLSEEEIIVQREKARAQVSVYCP